MKTWASQVSNTYLHFFAAKTITTLCTCVPSVQGAYPDSRWHPALSLERPALTNHTTLNTRGHFISVVSLDVLRYRYSYKIWLLLHWNPHRICWILHCWLTALGKLGLKICCCWVLDCYCTSCPKARYLNIHCLARGQTRGYLLDFRLVQTMSNLQILLLTNLVKWRERSAAPLLQARCKDILARRIWESWGAYSLALGPIIRLACPCPWRISLWNDERKRRSAAWRFYMVRSRKSNDLTVRGINTGFL